MSIPCKMRPVGGAVLPAGYKRVEWLEGPGKQYIETGYTVQKTDIVYAKLAFTKSNCFFLNQNGFNTNSGVRCVLWGENMFAVYFGNQNTLIKFTQVSAGIHEIWNAEKYVKFDDIIRYRESNVYGDPTDITLAFFDNTAEQNYSGGRIYEVKITNEKKTIRHFIPCLDPTGAPCMFELVTRKTFYNSGTGDFLYPTTSTTYALRRTIPDWGQLTENGLRRLYHAPEGYTGELIDYALENGYKPIVEPEKPEEGYWSPRWTETAEEIVIEWVKIDPPSES